VDPEEKESAPLIPAVPAFAVLIITLPLLFALPTADRMLIMPPVADELVPAVATIPLPTAPFVVSPTERTTLPPSPFTAEPVAMVMLPDEPALEAPVENINAPLTPELPASGVRIMTLPDDFAVLEPLRMLT
jgi:hypothetical protein